MIINVILPSSFHIRNQPPKGVFHFQLVKANRVNIPKTDIIDKPNIVVKGNSLIMNFDSNDTVEVQKLRRFTADLCKGLIVGVDQKNPITTDLPGVKEVIFRGD